MFKIIIISRHAAVLLPVHRPRPLVLFVPVQVPALVLVPVQSQLLQLLARMSMNHSQFHQLREALQIASLSVTLTAHDATDTLLPPLLLPTTAVDIDRSCLEVTEAGGVGTEMDSYDDQKQMNLVSACRKRSQRSGDEIPTRKGEQGENEKPVSSGNRRSYIYRYGQALGISSFDAHRAKGACRPSIIPGFVQARPIPTTSLQPTTTASSDTKPPPVILLLACGNIAQLGP
ncbi:hypothetical protein CMUS01_02063 [Colletotrichum musicola]|uniref:Uncharacterized protein n=1 Tax=Colletotrichum musicola TaxID=2175873 RepID=A0A8H6U7C4_9PEZI|nr:hypothetical protein CMUS01_02063 [Colletotrichum musicola]